MNEDTKSLIKAVVVAATLIGLLAFAKWLTSEGGMQ